MKSFLSILLLLLVSISNAQTIYFIEHTDEMGSYLVQLSTDIKKWKFDGCMNYDVHTQGELVLWP